MDGLTDEHHRSADKDDPEARKRSRGTGAIVRWGLLTWLGPGVVAWAVIACLAFVVVMVGLLAVFGVETTTVSDNFRYQCDSAGVGDPSASETATPAPRDAGGGPSDASAPTTNPYAALEPDDGDPAWVHACSEALKHAPYQGPPVRAINDGAAAECAARLAGGQVGRRVPQESLVRFVVYHASTASLTGRCEQPPPATDSSADAVAPTVDSPTIADSTADSFAPTIDLPPASTCPDFGSAMLMPDTVVAQGFCGQRVDITAPSVVSEGDLVFWDLGVDGVAQVGVAVGPSELVTADIATGLVVRQPIPVGGDVRVKRVLTVG